jgi:hypothetical protein
MRNGKTVSIEVQGEEIKGAMDFIDSIKADLKWNSSGFGTSYTIATRKIEGTYSYLGKYFGRLTRKALEESAEKFGFKLNPVKWK